MALFYVDCVSQQHLDETGVPMQGYITCTTIQGTAKPMYIDNSSSPVQHGAHANLDARGYVCIWVDGDTPSHFYLYDSYGRLVNSWLNITCKQGATGPQGPQGATGATGAKGDKGDTGPQGERGLTGPAGSNGRVMTFDDLTAEQKASLKGEQGERGATGATGAQGATGQQGPQGLQGEKGDTGPVGRGLEIDWPCSTKAELLQVTHPKVGDVGSVATDTIGEQTVNGTLYVWTMTNGTGSWQYHGTLGNTSSSVTGISFNANTITITQSGNNPDVTANVPTFNQNTTGTAAKATNAYNDEDGVSIKTYYAKKTDIPEGVELTSNKITAVVSTSTNTEYPSGKAVWDICDTKADDSAVVHKSENETIAGTKTFSSSPTLNDGLDSYGNLRLNHNGATSYHQIYTDSTNERYDVKLPNKSGTLAVDGDVVHKGINETITGDKTFTSTINLDANIYVAYNKKLFFKPAINTNSVLTLTGNNDTTERHDLTLPNKTGTLAIDGDVVHKTGDEVISGEKTFRDWLNIGKIWNNGTATFSGVIQFHNTFGAMIWNGESGKQAARLMRPANPPAQTESHDWYAVRIPNKGGTLAVQSDVDLKQDTLTAGSNITISGATISATDTTYAVTSNEDLDSIVSSLT